MTLEFEEAVFGTKKKSQFVKDVTCHTCNSDGAKPGTSKKHVVIVMGQVTCQLSKIQF